MDCFYCLIKLVKKKIEVYFIANKIILQNKYNYPICFTSFNIAFLILLLQNHDCFNSLSVSHYIYLGQEFAKVEIAIFSGQVYVQN